MPHPALDDLPRIAALAEHIFDHQEPVRHMALHHGICQGDQILFSDRSDRIQHVFPADLPGPSGNALFQNAQAVADRTVRCLCDEAESALVDRDPPVAADLRESAPERLLGNTAKVHPHAPGQNRRRQLFGLRRAQDEHHVFRRFLQCLQQRVVRTGRQHVDFVHDIDFFTSDDRRIVHALAQFTDVVDAVVRRRIDLDEIHERTFHDGAAVRTAAAGSRPFAGAVDRLGQKTCDRGLACPARPAEQIGMADLIRCNLILQNTDHVLLPQDLFKDLRSV